MKNAVRFSWLPFLIVMSLAVGCGGLTGPERGRHRIMITEMALSPSDFSNSVTGTPKDIQLYVLKDGTKIEIGKLDGFRGPKNLQQSFEIDYEPTSRYEFKIDEVAVLSEGKLWSISSSEAGNWPFDDGRVTFGSGSSVSFVDEKVR